MNSVSEKLGRVEFSIYYSLMTILFGFMAYTSWFSCSKLFWIPAVFGTILSVGSVIVHYFYYSHVKSLKYLLPIYIVLMIVTFLSSTVIEFLEYHIALYPFVMKCSLYILSIATAVKHFVILKKKLNLLERHST